MKCEEMKYFLTLMNGLTRRVPECASSSLSFDIISVKIFARNMKDVVCKGQ